MKMDSPEGSEVSPRETLKRLVSLWFRPPSLRTYPTLSPQRMIPTMGCMLSIGKCDGFVESDSEQD